MRDELLEFYEKELLYLRRTGVDFAKQHREAANRLQLEADKCDDPHVERLLEGFAFLAARVQLRLEDDFPELSDALLDVIYPQFTRPMPSISLVEFKLDPEQGKLTTGFPVPRSTLLYTRPVGGTACRFQTCYDTTLWPVSVSTAQWSTPHELSPPVRAPEAVAALRLELNCAPGVTFEGLKMDRLRLHIRADAGLAATLYELLCNNCLRILARDPSTKKEAAILPGSALRPVGFDVDEGLFPTPRRAFVGYRLLQEYFAFPDKFFFLDITEFEKIRAACPGGRAELVFLISSFERAERWDSLRDNVTADTIRLGCTPVINLFEQTSEPILLNQRHHEYVVVPDARRRDTTGIYSVEDVVATTPGSRDVLRFLPYYSFRHASGHAAPAAYWLARRRAIGWRMDHGTNVHLSFLDLSGRVVHPDADAVTVRLVCHNEDLPSRLSYGHPKGDFEMPGGGPIQSVTALVKPTKPVHLPYGRSQLWRLISHLSLNYVSLIEGGVDSLRELLSLHNHADLPAARRQIQGIIGVAGRSCHAGIESEHGLTFARGQRIELDFDEEAFTGGGVYLLASVLERFFGLCVSLNSFSLLAVRTKQRKELLREWPPRSGWKALI